MANTYGFDPVAWSIDGGRHRGELLRAFAFAATNGAEGIVAPGDCKVHQLTTPGPQVVVDAGAVLVRNRSAGTRNQTYVANARAESRLDVPPSGSSLRRHLVVVRIEDPQYSPWPKPPAGQEPDYQYAKPFIISDVPAGTTSASQLNLGYSAFALARLDVPAGVSNITDSHVVELRELALPREHRDPHGATMLDQVYLNWDWTFRDWTITAPIQSRVPRWATHFFLATHLVGVDIPTGGAGGSLRNFLGDVFGPAQDFDFNNSTTDGLRVSTAMFASGRCDHLQGQLATLKIQGHRNPNAGTASLQARAWGQVIHDLTYFERTL